MKLAKLLEMKTLIDRIRPKWRKTFAGFVGNTGKRCKFSEGNSANKNDAQNSPKKGVDIIVPETSQNDYKNESPCSREGIQSQA